MALDDDVVFHNFIEQFEEEAAKLGLYLITAQAGRRAFEVDGPTRPLVAMRFIVGDEAFSERVQNPQAYSDEAALAEMEHSMYEAAAAELVRRFQETGSVFDDDEED